jgi:hypothetical protein
MATVNITEQSKALFIAFAKDAANWNGEPLVGGNVTTDAQARGNLTQLKRAGLVTTFKDEGSLWLQFTPAGREYAKTLGIEL